jgi:type IV pilus assembly protein PilY1
MNAVHSLTKSILVALWISAALHSATSQASNAPEQTPLFVSEATPPLIMLVLGKDHSLFFEAYNDASDLDGDGELDLQFKPSIKYFGLFDSALCYTHNDANTNSGLFSPSNLAGSDYTCSGSSEWSGNWLNYITTSRVDALRKVLYGGQREVDTATQTILRRAYIPQDGHSWAKEYTSTSVNGYDITQYTPLSQPSTNRRHFFGNLTRNFTINCATLNTCSNLPPALSIVTNSTSRVWGWASSERPVLAENTNLGSGTRTDRTVRVEVCTSSFNANDCQPYGSGHKPVGLLHDFTDGSMLFGLLTGSYDQNMSGGVLRKVVSNFANEVDSSTGTFTANNTIVANLNSLRIRGYQNNNTNGNYGAPNRTRIMNQGEFVDWGNPIGEMMYETLRYFAGKGSATSSFATNSTQDTAVGLTRSTWDNPYASDSSANAASCAKPNMLVMSNVNTSYDSDQLPGSYFSSFSSDLSGLDVSAQANAITTAEGGIAGKTFFIGESGTIIDYAPTAKTVTSLAQVRGLSPEEPTKQGSFYPASVARFGATTAVNNASDKKTDTYVVALASPLPSFSFNVGGQNVSLVPFAKTIDGGNPNTNRNKSNYQPTDPIVDLYIEEYSSTRAVFRINFEADEQGNDFDSDVIVNYEITVNPNGTLTVLTTPTFQGTGSNQNLGYVISGTDRDGTYLVVQDKQESLGYFLNVPPGQTAGYCDYTIENSMPAACRQLPWINGTPPNSTQTFSATSTPAAGQLNSPLWYAAKYGIADRPTSTISGDPENYFLVTNASTLKDQLSEALNAISQANRSVTSPAVKPTTTQANDSNFFVYSTDYDVQTWSGNLIKETINTNSTDDQRTRHWEAASGSVTGRTIKMVSGTSLADFTWNNLSEDHQLALNTNPQTDVVDNAGEQRLGFIRGSNDTFRDRDNRLIGDIINSSPVVVEGAQYLQYLAESIEPDSDYAAFASSVAARKSLVFVGANDGMLHAFNADTGAEEFAFVPSAVIPNLNKLTSPDYNEEGGEHHFFVDGTPVVRDVYINDQWRTVLVGTLRAGGRSIFALDITDPNNIGLLWELNEGDDLQDLETLSDVGYSFAVPTIARLHNGNWAVVTGNGYDSASGRAVLLLIDIASGELTKIPTTASDSLNGLSSVRVADNNSDGIADYAYAGDLKGNLWRYDLDPTGSAGSNAYKVSFGGAPLFTAPGNDGAAQAITAPPSLVRHPSLTGYIVMFGSGRYFQLTDKETDKIDTIYGVWDKQTKGETASSTPELSRGNLQVQTFTTETTNTLNADNPNLPTVTNNIRILSDTPIIWHGPAATDGKYGWYLDLKVGDDLKGERIVDEMAARGQVLLFSTRTPSDDPCEAGLQGWTYGINPYTGGRTSFNVFDFNKDATVSSGDSYNGSVVSGYETPTGGISLSGDTLFSTDGTSTKVNFGPSVSGRQSWQLIPEND